MGLLLLTSHWQGLPRIYGLSTHSFPIDEGEKGGGGEDVGVGTTPEVVAEGFWRFCQR